MARRRGYTRRSTRRRSRAEPQPRWERRPPIRIRTYREEAVRTTAEPSARYTRQRSGMSLTRSPRPVGQRRRRRWSRPVPSTRVTLGTAEQQTRKRSLPAPPRAFWTGTVDRTKRTVCQARQERRAVLLATGHGGVHNRPIRPERDMTKCRRS